MKKSGIVRIAARLTVAAAATVGILANIACAPFGVGELDSDRCAVNKLTARGDTTQHIYSFDADCAFPGVRVDGKVSASYNTQTKVAQEKFKGDMGSFIAEWSCPRDPWLPSSPAPRCRLVDRKASLNVDNNALVNLMSAPAGTTPFSARIIDSNQQQRLRDLLDKALSEKDEPAPAPAPPPPPQPDMSVVSATGLQASLFDGQTGAFEVLIRNQGAATPTFTFTVTAAGVLDVYAITDVPGGFTCDGTAVITCTGTLVGEDGPAARQFAPLRLRGRMNGSGEAHLDVVVDGAKAVAEKNEFNNSKRFSWTVN